MIIHSRFIFRQITRSGKQAVVLILCVTLSILTLVALNGFGESIRQTMFRDARALHGADVIVRSRSAPVSRPVQDRIAGLEREGRIRSLKIHDFYSMVRPEGMENPVLADIKVVEPGYPFYGEVALKSGKTLRDVLTAGNIVAEQGLLERLHIAVGDRLRIGDAVLDVSDVVVRESNRPVNFLSFGPRIFVAAADLERLGLVRQGSRVTRSILIKVSGEETPEAVAADLRALADADMEQVETYQSARSRIRRFFDNFLFFLSLSAVFVLLLSGIGIHSALTAFLREKEQAIAILKALGGTGNFIRRNFLAVVFIFGSIGTIAGIACGLGLQFALPSLFGDLLPPDMKIVVSWQAVGEGAFLGLMVTGLFTFLPLHRLKQIRPGAVFRRERGIFRHGLPFYLNVAVILLFFTLTVLRYLEDRETGLWVIAGIGLLAGVMSLMTWLVLSGLRRLKIKNLAVRQALRGLFRTGSATGPAIVTLAASIGLISTIWLVEKNLDAAFINSYPPDAPNLFFIDIQPDQVADFSKTLGPDIKKPPQYYPVIRARLLSVNDEKIDRNAEHSRKTGDNLARPFNLTYRDNLLEDERMLDGKSLFRDDLKGLQVSVLDTVVKMKSMKIGDRLRFRIQGIPVDAVISSIRTRNQTSVKPFFYFVFPENSVVRTAPQTIFCAVRVEKKQLADVRFRIVSAFPNVSVIDVSETLASFAGIMHRLSLVIRFFTGFSIAAGVLMIVSSILATRFARLQEAVYFRILGAKSRFMTAVFALEHIFIGLTSGIMGIGMAQIATNILCTRIFETDYAPHLAESFLMLAGTVGMVLAVGLAASIPVLRQKPVFFLREAA